MHLKQANSSHLLMESQKALSAVLPVWLATKIAVRLTAVPRLLRAQRLAFERNSSSCGVISACKMKSSCLIACTRYVGDVLDGYRNPVNAANGWVVFDANQHACIHN